MWQYNHTNELQHHGVKGMRWGVRKKPDLTGLRNSVEKKVYAVGAKLNPREAKYKVRKITNRVNDDVESLANLTATSVNQKGVLVRSEYCFSIFIRCTACCNSLSVILDRFGLFRFCS